ncbi:TetR family transcriptional regulator [Pseudonocardia alni]|uniref:TetR family transcriptional regulator n=1 Tax=Pseudonocardia alni TaxID=33907 RepID=UPI001AD78BFC|nr:TetR family transcriptional regulator [Pseudonocardia alni]MBO4237557.1 TetR family transcriptional regulator [Pseudonocardia alni]
MSERRTMARRARDELRGEVLDAAERLAVAGERPSMPELARRVGVSRQTLYSEFGDRDGLASALVLRATDRFLDRIEAALDGEPDLYAAWVAAVDAALTEAGENPLIKALLSGDAAVPSAFGTDSGPIIAAAAERSAGYLRRVRPGAREHDVRLAAETAARLTVSHMVLPSGPAARSAEDIATVVVRTLGDALLRTASPAPRGSRSTSGGTTSAGPAGTVS